MTCGCDGCGAGDAEPWVLPSKGRVGMLCLIVAESAVFVIFVVAYLYYLGQNLSGPLPGDVLELPIFISICLLASSPTISAAVRALEHGQMAAFKLWWLATIVLGTIFLAGTAREWYLLIYEHGLTIRTQPVRHHLLLAGRTARVAPDFRAGGADAGDGVLVARLPAPRACRAHAPASRCTGTSSIGCGSSCSRWSTSSGDEITVRLKPDTTYCGPPKSG